MLTVIELPTYIKKAESCLSKEEQKEVIDYLSVYPEIGVLIQGTGGLRKIRWATSGQGKSGSVRVIYYYHNQVRPLYLITMFKKNEKQNLSKAEKNKLAQLTNQLKKGDEL